MESLPLLPGYSFSGADPTLKDYKLSQKLKFCNGFPMIRDSYGADDFCDAKLVEYDPELTYGPPRANKLSERQSFVPHYALYSGKCLSLEAYFKQGIFGSPDEHYRVRRVNLVYYLEDDTMAVVEPRVDNAGYPQGKLVKRGKIPKPGEEGKYYHWKDLNVGINIEIYGVVYRVINCNAFTWEFLTSQGIDVGDPEVLPPDPYMQNRRIKEQMAHPTGGGGGHELADDRHFKFLEYDGMVLTFDALWDDELFKVHYFLADDTIMVSRQKRLGDAPGMLLKRTKVPKNWKDLPATYPAVYLERTDQDVREYYSPGDLKIGETIFIFGRRFFLYDCDPFTRRYYSDMLRIEQPARIQLPDDTADPCPTPVAPPQPDVRGKRAQDLIRRLALFPKRLRYSLVMDAVRPEDEGREFVMEYNLSDGTIKITELGRRNAGRFSGTFLGWYQVPKPGTEETYSPEDFYIGGKLNIFGHWFVVTGTEPFVYKYMMANPQKFSERIKDNVKEHLTFRGMLLDESGTGLGDEEFGSVKAEEVKK